MSEPLVMAETGDDGVVTLTLNNGKVNALSIALLLELRAHAERLTASPPGAVLVLGGERIFAAGADISEFGGVIEGARVGEAFHTALDALAAIPRVVIAAVSGAALGGGCELALACDLRIASTRAKFGQPEILLGIIPGGGGTQRLPRLVGPARAKDMILTGRQVDAEEARAIGLVDRVVEPDELVTEALAWAASFAAGPLAAQAMAKGLIDRGLDLPLHDGLALERAAFTDVFTTDDSRIGVASFLEHGPGRATFTGR